MTKNIGIVLIGLCAAFPSWAQQYPAKPPRLIVPFAPGGPTDTVARIVAQKLGEQMSQAFVVENRPGADGFIAAELVAKSAPDGYTLLVASDAILAINPWLHAKLPYDPVKSFAPASLLTRQAYLLTVNAKVPAKTLRELIDYAKANPGKLNYGAGATNTQMAGELFQMTTGTKLTSVRFNGSAPTVQALVSESIEVVFSDIGTPLPHIRQGRARAIVTMGAERAKALPEVPTMAESYPGFELYLWNAVVAPAGTPAPVVDRLAREIQVAITSPETVARFANLGFDGAANSPSDLAALIGADMQKWRNVVAASGVRRD